MRGAWRALLQTVYALVERQAQAGDQERDGQHDADVEQVDEAFERISGGVFDVAVTTQTGATSHVSFSIGIGGLPGVVARACTECATGARCATEVGAVDCAEPKRL